MNAGDEDAGTAEEATADWTAGFDFEQIAEVEF